jgi:hypothetical protein
MDSPGSLAQPSTESHPRDAPEQLRTFFLLKEKVPAEIALSIIDYAGYWVKASISRDEVHSVSEWSGNPMVYLTSDPIKARGRVQSITFTICSHDQGWSDYPEDHGTYRNSWTWFEVDIIPPVGGSTSSDVEDSKDKWVATNRHAEEEPETQTVTFGRGERQWFKSMVPGSRVALQAHAKFSGWRNTVESATIDIYTSFLCQ